MSSSADDVLVTIASVFEQAGLSYALIGGHTGEPSVEIQAAKTKLQHELLERATRDSGVAAATRED